MVRILLSAPDLGRWRRPTAVHDPAKVITDLAITSALGGDWLADLALLRAEPGSSGVWRREREATGTLNSHLLVSRVTRSRDTPVHGRYLGRLLAPAGTTPSACRQTRIAQLVTDLDVKLTATALGMNDTGLVRYLAENVDRDRLTPTNRTARPDPGAPGATLHTLT